MNPPVLELEDVHRAFPTLRGPLTVLDGVSLRLEPGDRLVLFGPSGCGKTTLLHLMALLDLPDRGAVRLDGRDTAALSEAERSRRRARDIGLVFQQFHVLPHHSLRENLDLRLRYLPSEDAPSNDPDELLRRVGLDGLADRPARLLSGGEKQRLCIARALRVPPRLLLADEPTGNLDERNSRAVRELFGSIADADTPVVVATHDRDWLPFATRTMHFRDGRLLEGAP